MEKGRRRSQRMPKSSKLPSSQDPNNAIRKANSASGSPGCGTTPTESTRQLGMISEGSVHTGSDAFERMAPVQPKAKEMERFMTEPERQSNVSNDYVYLAVINHRQTW